MDWANDGPYSSRFATPIAWIIIRCISSAPTRTFSTRTSCIGRNFRSSMTLRNCRSRYLFCNPDGLHQNSLHLSPGRV